MKSSDDYFELHATHIDLTGAGVGVSGDVEVKTHGLFGEERALVEVVHRSRQHPTAVAKLVELRTPHPSRREAPCDEHETRRGRCSGCALMELGEDAQRTQKRAMLATYGLNVQEVVGGVGLGYRWSSKRVAFAMRGRLRLGSWARRSHVGAMMSGCLVDHPLIAAAADEVEREARDLNIAAYSEKTGEGDLRYVWLNTDGKAVVVTLIASRADGRVRDLAPKLQMAAGVAFSVQDEKGNAMRGGAPEVLRGDVTLRPRIAGVDVSVGPLAFMQPNPEIIALAYRSLVTDDEGVRLMGERAFDLYAGAGVTTALLREHFAEVLPCESYPQSAAALGIAPERALPFLESRSSERPGLVLANPPRKGLGAAVGDALVALGAPRVHIMSCGPAGLSRDLARLSEGGYRLTSLEAFDTLPQTPHVELVAKLARP